MYRLVNALVRDNHSGNRWHEEAIADLPIATIFNLYRDVVLIMTHDTVANQISLDLKKVVTRFSGMAPSITVSQWLTSLDGESLPTENSVPTVVSASAKYRDAYTAGYKLNLSFAQGHPLMDSPDSKKDDITMVKPGVDHTTFYKNCLVTVNGMVHRTDTDGEVVYIKDGGKSFRKANENHVGIINFKEVGELEFISIEPDMVYNPHHGSLRESAYIKLPVDIGNRMVMMVIGGYLHLIDSYYHCTGERVIKVDTANLPLLARFYESKKLIDLEPMTKFHDTNRNNEDHVALSDLFKDDSIRAYLTLSQSFVVLVNTDNLYLEKHKLGYTHLPGRYYSHQEPHWPARTELGRLPEYIAIPETGLWTLAIQNNFSTRYVFETTDWEGLHSADAARLGADPVYYSQGHLLEIGTDKLVYA